MKFKILSRVFRVIQELVPDFLKLTFIFDPPSYPQATVYTQLFAVLFVSFVLFPLA